MGHKVKQSLVNSRVDFFYYAFRNILLVSIPLLVISGVVLSHLSFHSSATGSTSGSDNLAITISSSCTLSSVVNIPHNAEVYNGNYLGDIGKTTITTLCNDGNGYSVYAVGYSNNEEGNNKLINTEYPQYSIYTGLATSGLASQWAMKLNNIPDDPSPTPPTIESDYNNVYGIVPLYWTKVASRTSGTTDMAQGSSFTTTYAVYASSSQYAGTYQGQVKYMLTHPSYEKPPYYMQEVDKWKNTIALEESVQAIDMRDGKKYWVTKLKDGRIWMTQNLDLDIGGVNTAPLNSNNTDISTNSNAYTGAGIYSDYSVSNGVYTWNPDSTAVTSGRTITYPNNTNNPTVSDWNDNATKPYSAEGGDTYYYTSNSTSNDTRYTSLKDCTTAHPAEAECERYFAGNYYNWTAAIASNNSTNISTNNSKAANSICPKGWRLPNASQTDNEYNEFGRLLFNAGITAALSNGNNSVGYANDGFNKLRSSPYYFVRSGFIYSSALNNSCITGDYWSGTVSSNTNAYFMRFNSRDVLPAIANLRPAGRSIRCIAR